MAAGTQDTVAPSAGIDRRPTSFGPSLRSFRLVLAAFIAFIGLSLSSAPAAADSISFTKPAPTGEAITPAEEFATTVLRNAWDMAEATDVEKTLNFSDIALDDDGDGIWTGISTSNDPAIFLLDPAATFRPIDAAKYFILSFRMYLDDASTTSRGQIFWYPGPDGVANIGSNPFVLVKGWNTYTLDLRTLGGAGGAWTGQIRGLRIDPTDEDDVKVRLDWVRLSGAGGAYTISWSVSDIPGDALVDLYYDDDDEVGNGVGGIIARDVPVSQGAFQWDSGALKPGIHYLLARAGRDYAALKLGDAWDMDDDDDIARVVDVDNARLDDDALKGKTSDDTAQVRLNVPESTRIDAARFHYLSYKMELEPWAGQVMRVFWRDGENDEHHVSIAASGDGNKTYTIDLAGHGGWRGTIKDFGISPAAQPNVEFALGRVYLTTSGTSATVYRDYSGPLTVNAAPAAQAGTGQLLTIDTAAPTADASATIRWTTTPLDPARPATLSLFYSTENTSGTGTKIADVPAAAGTYTWNTSAIPPGAYYVLGKLVDGATTTQKYSAAPLTVAHAAAPAAPAAPGAPGRVSLNVDTPAPGASVANGFQVTGWAAVDGSPAGTGVDAVALVALPAGGGPPTALGLARYGTPRPDVAARGGPNLTNSGYTATVNNLTPGPWTLAVFARTAATQAWSAPVNVPITVTGAPGAPAAAPAAPSAPSPAAPAAPAPAGPTAPAASERVRVSGTDGLGANLREQPGTEGALLKTLPDGAELTVVGADRQVDDDAWRNVRDAEGTTGWVVAGALERIGTTLPAPAAAASNLVITVDAPRGQAALGQPFIVSGSAIDRGAPAGTGVDSVSVYAFPTSGAAPYLLGAPQYGSPKPEVAATAGPQFAPSGFSLAVNGLPPGSYLLVVYAHSTVNNGYDHSAPIEITVT